MAHNSYQALLLRRSTLRTLLAQHQVGSDKYIQTRIDLKKIDIKLNTIQSKLKTSRI